MVPDHACVRLVAVSAAAAEIEAAQQQGGSVTGETCFQYLVNEDGSWTKPSLPIPVQKLAVVKPAPDVDMPVSPAEATNKLDAKRTKPLAAHTGARPVGAARAFVSRPTAASPGKR